MLLKKSNPSFSLVLTNLHRSCYTHIFFPTTFLKNILVLIQVPHRPRVQLFKKTKSGSGFISCSDFKNQTKFSHQFLIIRTRTQDSYHQNPSIHTSVGSFSLGPFILRPVSHLVIKDQVIENQLLCLSFLFENQVSSMGEPESNSQGRK